MKYIKGLSADMNDLLDENGRKAAKEFFEYVCWCIENDVYETIPKQAAAPAHLPVSPVPVGEEGKSGDVVIVTDCDADDKQLNDMIDRFRAVLKHKSRVVNISEFPFQGGCLGCFNCAAAGKCVYKDGFDDFLRKDIQTADAIIYAFTIKDHSMGSVFKMYNAGKSYSLLSSLNRINSDKAPQASKLNTLVMN